MCLVGGRRLPRGYVRLRAVCNMLLQGRCRTNAAVDTDTHTDALRTAERYGYAIFDALIITSALCTECGVLWSEDMQDGIIIERRLRVANPFGDP